MSLVFVLSSAPSCNCGANALSMLFSSLASVSIADVSGRGVISPPSNSVVDFGLDASLGGDKNEDPISSSSLSSA